MGARQGLDVASKMPIGARYGTSAGRKFEHPPGFGTSADARYLTSGPKSLKIRAVTAKKRQKRRFFGLLGLLSDEKALSQKSQSLLRH